MTKKPYIPYGTQSILEDDIDAVVDVLKSKFLTQGPVINDFETTISQYCKSDFSVACNSSTSALHVACLALGLGPGDWLWTSPITFVASANCALYCGAKVDFVDIDPFSYNLCVGALEKKLLEAKKQGKLPKIVVPVHLCGQSCEMEEIKKLSEIYGFKILEDASHAVGARYKKSVVGSCKYSDIAVFSFHPVKIVTTGEGGMAMTNDKQLAERMSALRSHGITRDDKKMMRVPDGSWYYEQLDLGFNYRMTDIQAALGLSQLKKLDKFVARRHILAKRYDEKLKDFPIITPQVNRDCYSAFHLYCIRLKCPEKRRVTFEYLRAQNIGVNVHYIPVYRHPYYQRFNFNQNSFPNAEAFYSSAISIPMYPNLSFDEQDRVIETLKDALMT